MWREPRRNFREIASGGSVFDCPVTVFVIFVNDMADLIRALKDLRFRMFYGALMSHRYPLVTLGNRATDCAWSFCPSEINSQSIIYSGGVGRDITFEHALVKQFGSNVLLFDPSPTGLETMSRPENKIPQFKYQAVALAGKCGILKFSRPLYEDEGSWFKQSGNEAGLEVPCVDLATLMRQNGHDHIDLLKIDIEGAEYEVIDDFLRRRLPIKQVLVEFHNNLLPGITCKQTIRALLKMRMAGYRLVKKDGENHSFIEQNL